MSPNKRVEIFKVDDDVDTEFDVDDEFAVIRDKLEELGINIQGKEIEVTINECNLGLKIVECKLHEKDLTLSVELYMQGNAFHDFYTVSVASEDSVAAEQIIELWNTVMVS